MMYYVNLGIDHADLLNLVALARDCANGDDDSRKLDQWLDAVDLSCGIFQSRLEIIRAIYPDYQYNPHSLFSDMTPDAE